MRISNQVRPEHLSISIMPSGELPWPGDRISKQGSARLAAGCAAGAVSGAAGFGVAAGAGAGLGAGIGNATSLPPLIVQVEFVAEDVARVIALIVAVAQGTYAFAPAVFGAIRAQALVASRAGEAPLFFIVAAIVQAAAIGCFLAGRRTRRRQARPAIISP